MTHSNETTTKNLLSSYGSIRSNNVIEYAQSFANYTNLLANIQMALLEHICQIIIIIISVCVLLLSTVYV